MNATLVCWPPEKLPMGRRRSSSSKPNRWNIISMSWRQVYPRSASISFCRWSYSAKRYLGESDVSSVSISFILASHVKMGAKVFLISSSTVILPSVKLICRRKPMCCFPAMVMPQVSSLSRLFILISPTISFSKVVFPHPFRPTMAIFSLLCISKFTSSSMVSAPY